MPLNDALGVDLHTTMARFNGPAWVKSAAVEDLVGSPDLPASEYAWPVKRLFPTHSPAATWLSAAYFETKRADFRPADQAIIQQALTKAAAAWGITAAVEAVAKTAAAQAHDDLSARPDSDFLYVRDGGRHLPVRNVEEVKAAAAWIETYRESWPMEDRRTMARRLLTKAAQLGADLGDQAESLAQTAGFGASPSATIARAFEARSQALEHRKIASELYAVARSLQGRRLSAEEREKAADALDRVDREYQLTGLYASGLVRPEAACFAVTEKRAEELLADLVTSPTGTTYRTEDLAQIPLDRVRDHLGDEFAEAVSGTGPWVDRRKVATILPTSPRGDAVLFDRLAEESGVHPVLRESGVLDHGSIATRAATV